jgi:hypothetical protein
VSAKFNLYLTKRKTYMTKLQFKIATEELNQAREDFYMTLHQLDMILDQE